MQALLIGAGGLLLGRAYPLDTPVVTIGRHRENTIVVKEPTVSRRHAEIRRDGDSFVIADKGSATGITVNGQVVSGVRRLLDGDRISIGRATVFVMQILVDKDPGAEVTPFDPESGMFTLPVPPTPAANLQIPIDVRRRQEQVDEIVESDFFRNLRANVVRRGTRPTPPPSSEGDPA